MSKPIPRIMMSFRVSGLMVDELDRRAADEFLSRSDLIRRMLMYALTHMPRNWKP